MTRRARAGEIRFPAVQGQQGRYADFHANRHTFITNLGRAGVPPKTTQELARHSDIRLTMNVYSHTDLAERPRRFAVCQDSGSVLGVRRSRKMAQMGNQSSPTAAEPNENGRVRRLARSPCCHQ